MSGLIREADLREQLLREDVEYQRLAAEHKSYDSQLESLASKHYLSEEDKLRERTLKKKKLLLKDQMYSMIQKIRSQMSAESK
jgi:uncharacterized protein YdcH (DUF465 family)